MTIDDIEKNDGSDTKMPVKKAEKEKKLKMEPKINQSKEVRGKKQWRHPALSLVRVGKMKGKTYNLLHRGPVYEAILKKKITRKDEIGGNFEIPYFVILEDIKEDKKRPFILGTPFLTKAKAVIKFDKGTITLRSRKSYNFQSKVIFDKKKLRSS
ncbi:zinc finger, CCHC-type containing protein [Tanacetum coccineum]